MYPVMLASMVGDTAKQFGVDWPHFIAQLVSFSIVCFLLYKFAYSRVLAMLAERRKTISEGLANAKTIKAELARTETDRQAVMAQANTEAAGLVQEARAVANRVKEQETQKAIAAAEQIMVKAREAAEREHERMLSELKREVGRLVVQTTATVTGKVLTSEDQKRLTEETALQIKPG